MARVHTCGTCRCTFFSADMLRTHLCRPAAPPKRSYADAFDGGGDPRTRVVIATNIAESSLTIPGVTAVIDTGRAKTVEFVPRLAQSMLRTTWTSQASATQRSGRAGRVAPVQSASGFGGCSAVPDQMPPAYEALTGAGAGARFR